MRDNLNIKSRYKRTYLGIKERIITQLLNTVKEVSTINITQSA